MIMKKTIFVVFAMLYAFTLSAQDIHGFVTKQMQTYPKSRLLDIYKSCFQDYMGAEHLVSDKQRVKAYLDEELQTTSLDDLMPWYYEACGIDSSYYRVSIRTIKESVISEDLLLDAFIRSANSKKRPTVDSWRDRWHVIIGTIDKMQLELPYYQQDKAFIDSILSVGRYAISHSPEYREAYHPHYRIVERGIFERELKPLIEHKYLQNKNNDMNYYSVEDDEISITVNGTTAEMTGRSRVNAAVYGGGRHTWRLQMKSKLAKNDGRWQFVESKASTY